MSNDTTPPPAPVPLTLEQIRMAQARHLKCQGCIYFFPSAEYPDSGYCVRNAPLYNQKPPFVDAKDMYCGEFHPNP